MIKVFNDGGVHNNARSHNVRLTELAADIRMPYRTLLARLSRGISESESSHLIDRIIAIADLKRERRATQCN